MKSPIQVGILYESNEWSDHKLRQELQKELDGISDNPIQVELIDMEDPQAIEHALTCSFLISRVFASAQFRGHEASLARMEELIPAAEKKGILLINPGCSHGFEISKLAATQTLAKANIDVPEIYAFGTPDILIKEIQDLSFPSIIKPDCGGRTTATALLHNIEEARDFLQNALPIPFIVEEYITPTRGYITRIEIIDGLPELIVKRSIANNGLSTYHLGCTYESYSDCPEELRAQAIEAARILGFVFGSFDVIENDQGAFFIDANSVSNVSEDCTELLHMDLMKRYAEIIANSIRERIA